MLSGRPLLTSRAYSLVIGAPAAEAVGVRARPPGGGFGVPDRDRAVAAALRRGWTAERDPGVAAAGDTHRSDGYDDGRRCQRGRRCQGGTITERGRRAGRQRRRGVRYW